MEALQCGELLGVKAGPKGLMKGDMFEITDEHVSQIMNTGGFDFLGTDRTKIERVDDIERVKNVCRDQNIDAIVIVGGDDSNTNAALLAEKLFSDVKVDGGGVQVIGVPKTIDGDLQIGQGVMERQSVVYVGAGGLIGETGAVHRCVEPIAAAVPGKHTARAVGAVGGGSQANH